ncbi:MAG: SUMF1/EgtB/PvdO family nonheme iron enzyme [Candidatus Nealsonbacteria bacterium]|nr:SUMF1/EgtB/PvdO family nonheme iron enzyme [Candidatus Nealsonbacteria bacterium]
MKRTSTVLILAACLLSATSRCFSESTGDNDGVLNGPLTDRNLGHRASGEGDKESLRLAIEDLTETYGNGYPKGKEFLERLQDEKVQDANSEEFKALKREALLLCNPAIDFDGILLVRAGKGGRRYSNNWETRSSCDSEVRKISDKDVKSVLQRLRGKDEALKDLYDRQEKTEKEYTNRRNEMHRSEAFKKEKDNAKRDAMLKGIPEFAKSESLKKALHAAGMKHAEYAQMYKHRNDNAEVGNYEDELVVMSMDDGKVTTIYKPSSGKFIGDVDLHFDADKVLFSSFRDKSQLSEASGQGKGYGVFEIEIDATTGKKRGDPRVISPDMGRDIDCYDACYLADGRIIFASTASYEGVPCVGGGAYVANLFRMNNDGTEVRRLTFDQDASWHPSVMENGRVMFTRWEYTDSAHYFSRVLMHMNPDGTDQKALYGSNSYWPNSMFYARQIPGKPSMFISTITGHHSNAKGGALCLFDVSQGRHEADGAVQFLTGRGKKVHPLVIDGLHGAYSPMFYNPYPINDTYFLATTSSGDVLLLDLFDNIIPLKAGEDKGKYYEPIPLRKTKTPFVRPDRVLPGAKEAMVLISDVYLGPGLKGVPRGTVKNLRVYRYEYGPRHKGGHYSMGMEAGWDSKQVLGIAPVEDDGSANFRVPANTPFAMQPLDKDGKALHLMRSWTVAMPGETLTCVGCHESQNTPPPTHRSKAMFRRPSRLEPFYGQTRGFSFQREVQPVIDRYCGGCHDGAKDIAGLEAKGIQVADRIVGTGVNTGKRFREVGIPDLSNPRAAHTNLHPYVRRNGPEGDYHMLTPLEFHVDTSELTQMLVKGHHNVELDEDAWTRLYTWMDLNAPFHGTWTEAGAKKEILDRRMELRKLYAFDEYNPEEIINPYEKTEEIIMPAPLDLQPETRGPKPVVKDYKAQSMELDLGDEVTMKLVAVPSGEFSMGSGNETPVERPVSRVKINKGFMMGATEVTLGQYRQFDPEYLNGVYDMHYKDQVHRGYYMNDMQFPVIRVTWQKAVEYCKWLSAKTGKKVSLPTEAQWEWACRAGTETPLSYGDLDTDFSKHANLADLKTKEMAVSGVNPKPISNPGSNVDFELKDPRFNDNVLHLAKAGSFEPNQWGLHDMHGNAAEWTRSAYEPYPYNDDGRNGEKNGPQRVVRGGSWHDRPFRCTSSFRLGYPDWQRVYHTGFRVVVED